MGKKLAIKGHLTRGEEVIEILKMLGGNDDGSWWGCDIGSAYFINDCTQKIDVCRVETDIVVFTLEKFLEKYPYKVGDKVIDCYGNTVTIKLMKWSDDFETMVYDFEETEDVLCAEDIEAVNDIHTKPSKMKNVLAELLEHIKTTPKEELEREFEEIEEWSNVGPTIKEFRTFCECVNRKPKYPKTYEECCQHLGCDDKLSVGKLIPFQQLINARNAYWKIAGEEMGLGKPWEPAMQDTIWGITRSKDEVEKYSCHYGKTNLLEFPTEEIRDAFYENFKKDIEQCKELL